MANAVGRLTSMFRDKQVISGFTSILANEVQTLEDCVQFFLFIIQLSNHPYPGGPWDILDKYGKILGEPRNGRSDDDTRRP